MSIFEILKKDHREVKAMFRRISMASGRASATRKRTFEQLTQALQAHMAAEEKVYYSALKRADETRVSAIEALEEHRIGKLLLKELARGSQQSPEWEGKFKAFRSIVEHHIEEEEEEVFKESREVLDETRLNELGERFLQEKQRFMSGRGQKSTVKRRKSRAA